MAKAPFQSRIVGEGFEAPDQLLANPLNWRRHPKNQQDALEAMLRTVGWVQRVIVNKTTGHIVDGHLRVEVALRRDEPAVPVLYVQLSEEEEKVVLAAIDPIGGLAETDQTMLDDLLEGVETGDADLDAFLASLRAGDFWDSDISKVESAGENTDGIEAKIVVRCAQLDSDDVRATIERALAESGIEGVKVG
jgi:hypothetical protein